MYVSPPKKKKGINPASPTARTYRKPFPDFPETCRMTDTPGNAPAGTPHHAVSLLAAMAFCFHTVTPAPL